jgi:hypothetical protein
MFVLLTNDVERPLLGDLLLELHDDADHVRVHPVQVQREPRAVEVPATFREGSSTL